MSLSVVSQVTERQFLSDAHAHVHAHTHTKEKRRGEEEEEEKEDEEEGSGWCWCSWGVAVTAQVIVFFMDGGDQAFFFLSFFCFFS